MALEADIRTYLMAQAPLVAAIGNRLHVGRRPQGDVYPAITYRRISGQHEQTLTSAAGFARGRYRFTVWDNDSITATDVAELLRLELDGYRGLFASRTIHAVVLQDDAEDHEDTDLADDLGLYPVTAVYLIVYADTIPTF